VTDAARNGNDEVGARSLETTGKNTQFLAWLYPIFGRLQNLSVRPSITTPRPIRVRDVARVELRTEMRRDVVELHGEGEVTGGTAIRPV
jgi:Cu/Ag efflux pump CusA